MLKNLLITLGLSAILLAFGLFVFLPKSEAQSSILPSLIDIPAPPPPNPLVTRSSGERPPEFFRKDNPPPDDAPIADLIDYWQMQKGQSPLNYAIEPSPRVLERLLDEIERNPGLVGGLLGMLAQKPKAVDTVKRIYDRALGDQNADKYQITALKNWLMYNSDYFSDDLLQAAQQVRDTEEYVTNQEDVLALARVDWDRARPLLDRMLNDQTQPVSRTVANWAYYLHALERGNSIEAESYREALMRVVEDKNALPGNRDLAFDALVYGGDFPGRDDWYFRLMEDETLHNLRVNGTTYTGLTTLLLRAPPDRFVDKMLQLLKSSNVNVRSAAIRNLTSVLRDNDPEKVKEVLTALLPWLRDPDWAKQIAGERRGIVEALAHFEIPESVPGLIAILNEKAIIEVDADEYDEGYSANYAANLPRVSGNTNAIGRTTANVVMKREVFPYRESAINALIEQKSVQAAAALRQVLPEVEPWKRGDVVKAILVSGGFTIPEQIEGLEFYAKQVREMEIERTKEIDLANAANSRIFEDAAFRDLDIMIRRANTYVAARRQNQVLDPGEIKLMLGGQVAKINEPGGELVSAVIYRIKYLEINDPPIAEVIRSIMQTWQGDAVYAILLEDLGAGKSTLDALVKLLSIRKALRENQIPNIYNARAKGNPIAYGISACLLENDREYDAILSGGNDEVRTAMLGCARLVRARLPVQTVASFLKSSNKLLALAAERYIESEDSPAARQIIYSLYPNEAKITGARFFFGEAKDVPVNLDFLSGLYGSVSGFEDVPPYYYSMILNSTFDPTEEKLKKEVLEDEKLLGIYAYDKNFVRMYPDRAVFSWEEDEARYRERKLNESEFSYLKSYLVSNDINSHPPFISYCPGCVGKELLMLGKQGGRRIFLYSYPTPKFFEGLDEIFSDMRRPPANLRYWLEKDIAGVKILFADQDLEAKAVWKNGDDLRVLINNTPLEEQIERELNKLYEADSENENLDYAQTEALDSKRRADRAFASYSWRRFSGNKLGEFINQPAGVDFITKPASDFYLDEYSRNWSVKSGNVEVRMVDDTLLKVVNGQIRTLKTGYYSEGVITGNGRWVILSKFDYETEERQIVRINLQTNREITVKFARQPRFSEILAFMPSVNKVLINTGNTIDYSEGKNSEKITNGSYFLLDPETGVIRAAKGEFRPILDQTFRPLQKASAADEVWVAIPEEDSTKTQIGTYNTKTFEFRSVLDVPRIGFNSMDMWVDEPQNKVYIVYNGQLLAIPLKKETVEMPN